MKICRTESLTGHRIDVEINWPAGAISPCRSRPILVTFGLRSGWMPKRNEDKTPARSCSESVSRHHEPIDSASERRVIPTLVTLELVTVQSAARSQPALRGVTKSIDNITARIDRLDASPEVDRCKKLLEELKAAVKACEDRMSVSVKAKRKDKEVNASEIVPAASA